MNRGVSSIWADRPPDSVWEKMRKTLSAAKSGGTLQVFFRTDDIGYVDDQFRQLMRLFQDRGAPLCLAVVPDWLDRAGWQAMGEFEPQNDRWCWHQHGRRHANHERQGKKGEFGDSRPREELSRDLAEGREHLAAVMGDLFFPVFTPPWNRCGLAALELLREQGFLAVSRSKGAKPSAKGILPDLAVNVDLHTRREEDFTEGWQNLTAEIKEAADSGCMGIMLHHQLMNEAAFSFLDLLLRELGSLPQVSLSTFRELLPTGEAKVNPPK